MVGFKYVVVGLGNLFDYCVCVVVVEDYSNNNYKLLVVDWLVIWC